VASRPSADPRFGRADLSNCEREQVHLAGSIQPHGALLVVEEPDLTIVQASANAAAFLGLSGNVLGRILDQIADELAGGIAPHLHLSLDRLPMAVRCHAGARQQAFDVLIHRATGGGLVIELELAGPKVDLSREVGTALQGILSCPSVRSLCDETARIFRDLTG
jgi:light-regulated signal transduction histidine kinase (bacteriophytochrome)